MRATYGIDKSVRKSKSPSCMIIFLRRISRRALGIELVRNAPVCFRKLSCDKRQGDERSCIFVVSLLGFIIRDLLGVLVATT
jgi:hypothetical protein